MLRGVHRTSHPPGPEVGQGFSAATCTATAAPDDAIVLASGQEISIYGKTRSSQGFGRQITGNCRIAGQGKDDFQVPGWQLYSRGQHWAHSRLAPGSKRASSRI